MNTRLLQLASPLIVAILSVNVNAESIPEADIIATVNGTPITIAERTAISKQLIAADQATDDKRVTSELVNLELLKQEAIKRKLDQDPAVVSQMKAIKTRLMANAAMVAISQDIELSDADIKTEYDQQIADLDLKEFKASHILLKDEVAAIAVIDELKTGADFAGVAKEKSTGPSGPNGGDLGWFNSKSMVPEFSAAVRTMQVGDISAKPVKTQFGYHVIKLMDTRESPAPKLEDIKGKIEEILIQKNLRTVIENLRKSADIVIK